MRVLVVEDELRLAENVARSLRESAGYAVDIAAYGEEGLFLAESNAYDVMLLDLMLPKLDGMELLRRMRRQKGKRMVAEHLRLANRHRSLRRLRGGSSSSALSVTAGISRRSFAVSATSSISTLFSTNSHSCSRERSTSTSRR